MNDVELMLETLSHDLLVTDSPRAAQLVSAAAYGDSALEDALDGVQVERPHQGPPRSADLRGPLFLRRLEVGGFRGIGSGIALEFFPGPGLTVLFGANGSGKSSLLEALGLAATGKLRRVEGRTAVWKQAMGNLHHPGPVTVAAEFLDLPASRASRVQIRATSPRGPDEIARHRVRGGCRRGPGFVGPFNGYVSTVSGG